MTKVDEDLIYITNSLRRMDIMYILGKLDFARNYEIADILCINPGYVSTLTKDLKEQGFLDSKVSNRYKVYSLSEKGEKVVQKLRDYHGID